MNKYSEFEYKKVFLILKQFKKSLKQTSSYRLVLTTFDSKNPTTNYGQLFIDAELKELPLAANVRSLKGFELIFAMLTENGDPILHFQMRQNSCHTYYIEKVYKKEHKKPHFFKNMTSKDWEVIVAAFIENSATIVHNLMQAK